MNTSYMQAIGAVKPEVDAMFGNFKKWYNAMLFNATDPSLPVKPDTPVRFAHEPEDGCPFRCSIHEPCMMTVICHTVHPLKVRCHLVGVLKRHFTNV